MNYFTNETYKRRFTQLLQELVCSKKMDLKGALLLMSRASGKDAVVQTAKFIYESLLKGEVFSNALKTCSYIEFDVVYISFLNFAERGGCLENALLFLKQKCDRQHENVNRIIEVCVYPTFVILLAVGAGILLTAYSSSIFIQADVELKRSLFFAFGFLLLFCITVCMILKQNLGTDKLYEAFLAMGFLVKGGESIANAAKAAVNVLGYETKEGMLFARAAEKLSYGLSLREAFSFNNRMLEQAFFYAENSGGENDVFEKIALWLNTRDEKKRLICIKLIEPVFISGTGIFLLIFLVNLVLPLFSEGTFFL